jgi:butyryl-CoA dehydrogenase
MAGGSFYRELMNRIEATIGEAWSNDRLAACASQLSLAVKAMTAATDAINAEKSSGNLEKALANSSLYLEAFGHTVVGWLWLRQALKAVAGLEGNGGQTPDFYEGKVKACEFFTRYELPKVVSLSELLKAMDTTPLDMVDAEF